MKKTISKMFATLNARYVIISAILLTLIAVCLTTLALGVLPPWSRDALIHHLTLPNLVLLGRLDQVSDLSFWHYPQNIQIIYGFCIWLGADWLSHWVHAFFAWATGYAVFRFLRNQGIESVWCWFGLLFFLTLPIIFRLSVIAYVDLALLFFSTQALFHYLYWTDDITRKKELIWCAVFCGLAMGTKYNGLIVFTLITFFVIWTLEQHRKKGISLKKLGSYFLFFGIPSLVIALPWYIRNMIEMANPVYPLFGSLFGSAGSGETLIKPVPHLIYRHIGYGESIWEIILLPLRIFFQGQDDVAQYFDGVLNPFLLIFSLPVIFFKKEKKNILLIFVLLYFSYAFFFTGLRIRYILPIVPPLVVLSIFSLQMVCEKLNFQWKNGLVFIFVSGSLFLNFNYMIKHVAEIDPYPYIFGKESKEDFLSRTVGSYPAIQYINENLPRDAKVLLLMTGNRNYYLERDWVSDEQFGINRINTIFNMGERKNELKNYLKKINLAYLLLHIERSKNITNNLFNSREKKLFDEFLQDKKKMFVKNGYAVIPLF